MLSVRVAIMLPYRLMLPDGVYPTREGSVTLKTVTGADAAEPRHEVSGVFQANESPSVQDVERQREREAERLLRRVNHLIRSYRAASLQADVLELSRAQAGTFRFIEESSAGEWGGPPFEFALPIVSLSTRTEMDLASDVRAALQSGTEPDVGDLNILDARHAVNTGRFREAVLLAWSAIDATFTKEYKRVLGPLLANEYAAGRDYVLEFEIPMKVRMTAVLSLANKKSLFHELGKEWEQFMASYSTRNDVIHRGDAASQEQAESAIRLARRIVLFARGL